MLSLPRLHNHNRSPSPRSPRPGVSGAGQGEGAAGEGRAVAEQASCPGANLHARHVPPWHRTEAGSKVGFARKQRGWWFLLAPQLRAGWMSRIPEGGSPTLGITHS